MKEVGVRELKQSLSQILRTVGRGGRVRVTLRGRPIADIIPAREAESESWLRELVAQGRIRLPSRSHPPRNPRLARASRRASDVVLTERESER